MSLCCCLFLAFSSLNVYAADDHASLDVVDSTQEYVELQKEVMKTLYRQESYQDTCIKREPYVENVCGDETKYKRECTPVPGRQHCYTYNDRQCSTSYETECRTTYDRQCSTRYERECETSYERECSTSYERECRTEPGRVECSRAPNGEQVCQKIPPTQSCENVPKQQCRNVPRQECRDVPRQDCREIPRQECSQVPKENCYDVPKNKCEWIPATEECRDIPYKEKVCKDVTKYKEIPYKCTKQRDVPYQVRDQLVIGKINFEASRSQDSDLTYKANFSINNQKNLDIGVTNVSTSKPIILRATKSQKESVNGDVKTIEAKYVVKEEKPTLNSALNGLKISWVSLTREKITIALNKEIDVSNSSMNIEILKGSKTYLNTSLSGSQFSVSKRGGMTYLTTSVIEHGGSELDGILNKKFHVNLVLKNTYQIQNPESVIYQNVSQNLKSEIKFSTVVKRD